MFVDLFTEVDGGGVVKGLPQPKDVPYIAGFDPVTQGKGNQFVGVGFFARLYLND